MENPVLRLTRTQNILLSLGCAAPVIGSYYIIPRHTLPFDFYDHYFIFIALHIYNILSPANKKGILPSWIIKGLSIFVLSTLIASLDRSNAFNFGFFKQFFGAIFSASSYFIIFRIARYDIILLFRKYCFFAFIAACIGIIEEIFHLMGIHVKAVFPGSLGLFRVGGLSGEPYNLSLALFPAVFFYLLAAISGSKINKENSRVQSFKSSIIFITFFLTFSSTGFVGLFVCFIVIAIHKGYLNPKKPRVLLAPVFFTAVYFLFAALTSSDKNLNRKLSEGIWFLQGEEKSAGQLVGTNSSSFALMSNYYIAMAGFAEHPIAGVGLGNYESLYHDKFAELFGTRFLLSYGKSNYNDANSMFLRLIAETGLIGTSTFFVFIIAFLIKASYEKNPFKFYLIAINHGIFILFLIRLLRCGNYLSDGMFFFILLYFYSFKHFRTIIQGDRLVAKAALADTGWQLSEKVERAQPPQHPN